MKNSEKITKRKHHWCYFKEESTLIRHRINPNSKLSHSSSLVFIIPETVFFRGGGGMYIYFFVFHTCFKVVTYTKHRTWQKIMIEAFLFTCHSFSTPKVRRKGKAVSLRRMCAYVRGDKVVRLFPSYARKIE